MLEPSAPHLDCLLPCTPRLLIQGLTNIFGGLGDHKESLRVVKFLSLVSAESSRWLPEVTLLRIPKSGFELVYLAKIVNW